MSDDRSMWKVEDKGDYAFCVIDANGKYVSGLENFFGRERSVADQIVREHNAYLAEHPADDEEPVTEDWLRAVGSKPIPGVSFHAFDLGLFVQVGVRPDGSLCIHADRFTATLKMAICTRGDVRRLCAALGVPLK